LKTIAACDTVAVDESRSEHVTRPKDCLPKRKDVQSTVRVSHGLEKGGNSHLEDDIDSDDDERNR